MDNILIVLQEYVVIITVGFLFAFIFIFLLIRKAKHNSYKKEFEALNIEYNSIRSVPLNFKLNKAVAIAKVNEETMNSILQCKDDYIKIQNNFEQLTSFLAETDDNLTSFNPRLAKNNLLDLATCIEFGKEQVEKLEKTLDQVLEKEAQLRTQSTQLKDEFRDLKISIQNDASKLSFAYPKLESCVISCEQLFSTFEEYMYASEFEKSYEILDEIERDIYHLNGYYTQLPDCILKAKGLIPNMLDELKREYALTLQKGAFLDNLNYDSNIEMIQEVLKNALANIENLKLEGMESVLENAMLRIQQLQKQVSDEAQAYYQVKQFVKSADANIQKSGEMLAEIKEIIPKVETRFGLTNLTKEIDGYDQKYTQSLKMIEEIKALVDKAEESSIEIFAKASEAAQIMSLMEKDLTIIKEKVLQACQDERRAEKQLVKLQLITNEMNVKIIKNKLPSISEKYDSDVRKANHMIKTVEDILAATPLDIQTLTYELKAAIDFTYKLYNNVNNVVGTAAMVENAIVFANKYRSNNPSLDSDLTRCELCYRNGEYVHALEIALDAIEKFHPNSFETKIKENALSAR